MIELFINGRKADVEQKPFTYTLQVNDMFNFDTREISYSETIYLPTTPANNIIFGFANEPLSDKVEAYKTHKVDYYVNGIPIVQGANGFLVGKRGNYFIFEFKDKSKDIYNYLVGKKLTDLPLQNLNHTKNEDFIKKQQNSDNVVYALADYGRQYSSDVYDYDGCMPSIRMDWILSQIKKMNADNNFAGSFFESELWKSLYMTTSDPKALNQYERKEVLKEQGQTKINGNNHSFPLSFNGSNFVEGEEGEATFTIKEQGTYFIYIDFYASRANSLDMRIGGLGSFGIDSWTSDKKEPNPTYYRTFGRILEIGANEPILLEYGKHDNTEAGIIIEIYKYEGVVAETSVNDFSLVDWFKEILRLFSITPIRDRNSNKQNFYTLSERVNAPVINWSDKFIQVKEDKYHNTNYSQVNNFVYSKYDEQTNEQKSNDYSLIFKDEYLSLYSEFKSKFFSAKNDLLAFKGLKIPRFEFWQQEIKNGKAEFKEKNNRFHIFNAKRVNVPINAVLTKQNEQNHTETIKVNFNNNNPIVADFTLLKWENLLKSFYKDLPRLMEHPYIVTAEFALSEIDIYEFSFFSRIYVEQLGGYFLPNKIKYKAGALAEVEMIKIS